MCSPFGASWRLGDGDGSAFILGPENDLSASLVGYLEYSDVIETFNGSTLVSVTADINILPTPEPATWSLCLAGLAIAAFRARTFVQTRTRK